jgi:uncharacterized protein (TIGR02145 family)
MKKPVKLYLILLTTLFINLQTIAQINGKLIGEQIWATSNLNVSKFQNGDVIFEAKTNAQWVKAEEDKKPAWCYYQNNAQNGVIYGKLYNWYAVNDPRGLSPKGWHIPSEVEWKELISFLKKDRDDVNEVLKNKTGWKQYTIGGDEVGSDCEYCNGTGQRYSNISYKYITCANCGGTGGDKFKTKKSMLSGNGTNTSGFSAKPGSSRYISYGESVFSPNIGFEAFWWVADKIYSSNIRITVGKYLPEFSYEHGYGCYVRLVQDNPEKMEKYRIAEEAKIEKIKIDSISRVERKKNNPVFVLGKSISIGTLEVAEYDFSNSMNWNEANKLCESIGNGWRLPAIDELENILCLNKDKIGGFSESYYWSSTKYDNNYTRYIYFGNCSGHYKKNEEKSRVRAVRTIK